MVRLWRIRLVRDGRAATVRLWDRRAARVSRGNYIPTVRFCARYQEYRGVPYLS